MVLYFGDFIISFKDFLTYFLSTPSRIFKTPLRRWIIAWVFKTCHLRHVHCPSPLSKLSSSLSSSHLIVIVIFTVFLFLCRRRCCIHHPPILQLLTPFQHRTIRSLSFSNLFSLSISTSCASSISESMGSSSDLRFQLYYFMKCLKSRVLVSYGNGNAINVFRRACVITFC